MKHLFVLILIFFVICSEVFAFEADDSVDDIIKKTYNAESSSLPKLPKTSPKSVESANFLDTGKKDEVKNLQSAPPSVSKTQNANVQNIPKIPQKITTNTKKIAYGKKINVKFNTSVSDGSVKGARVSFVSQAPLVTKNITLPTGTVIYGTVINSHKPQMLGNGGLLAIKAEYITYNGKTSYCEGNIVSLNHKHILFNNIKGKNGYIKGISKTIKPAKNFYDKSLKVSKKLWNSPGFIIAPITYLPGAVFLAGDAVASPFIALFHKGERVYVKNGTPAVIKLTAPAYIEY